MHFVDMCLLVKYQTWSNVTHLHLLHHHLKDHLIFTTCFSWSTFFLTTPPLRYIISKVRFNWCASCCLRFSQFYLEKWYRKLQIIYFHWKFRCQYHTRRHSSTRSALKTFITEEVLLGQIAESKNYFPEMMINTTKTKRRFIKRIFFSNLKDLPYHRRM